MTKDQDTGSAFGGYNPWGWRALTAGIFVSLVAGALWVWITPDGDRVASSDAGTTSPTVSLTSKHPGPGTTPTRSEPGPTVAQSTEQIYAWYYLADVGHVADNFFQDSGPRSIAGTDFPRSFAQQLVDPWDEVSWTEFLLRKTCNRFEAQVGHHDHNVDTELKVTVEVAGDRRLLASRTVSYGERKKISAPLSGVLRLRLTARVDGEIGHYSQEVVWGDARIRCRVTPDPVDPYG